MFYSHLRYSVKKGVFFKISQNSLENTCTRVSFVIKLQASAGNFIQKETLAQVFSREFYEILKNTFFTEHLRTTALHLLFSQAILKSKKLAFKIFSGYCVRKLKNGVRNYINHLHENIPHLYLCYFPKKRIAIWLLNLKPYQIHLNTSI